MARQPVEVRRRFPIGAELVPGKGAHFRVWAPASSAVAVQFLSRDGAEVKLEAEANGYFSGYAEQAMPGSLYKFRLDEGSFPDPASRFQPEGPHGPSQIVDPVGFKWQEEAWPGVSRKGQVIYEMHVGTFTPAGTWRAAMDELPELARLGLTVIEVMPVADFPGDFGWGYDGVSLFAPTRLYGTPDDFRAFVARAHSLRMGVILDVVYNHLGPDGNYLKQFSPDYFSRRHHSEWGEGLNFDDENCTPVREFFMTNAAYWIEEFHLDGLRLDATQQIFDASPNHILAAISRRAREAAGDRSIWLVAENETQHARLARPFEQDGYGLDALWNDDFHHVARVAATGKNEAYYSDYRGSPQEFISAVKRGYLYQGQWSSWQKKPRGAPALDLHPEQFVNCLQNHDQVANSFRGERLHDLTSPGRLRALTALLLLAPGTPMLFQGQEFAASAPFLYFADHHAELALLVARGRHEFLRQFPSIAALGNETRLAPPHASETFQQCKLHLSERRCHAAVYELHRQLLALRRDDPVFANPQPGGIDGAVLGPEAFGLRFFGPGGDDRLLLVNLGLALELNVQPEPLLAPPEGRPWALKWSSEAPELGGGGTAPLETQGTWRLPGQAALLLAPQPATEE